MTTTVDLSGYHGLAGQYSGKTHLIEAADYRRAKSSNASMRFVFGLRPFCGFRGNLNGMFETLDGRTPDDLCQKCLAAARRRQATPAAKVVVGTGDVYTVRFHYSNDTHVEDEKPSEASARRYAREALTGAERWIAMAKINPSISYLVRADVIAPDGTAVVTYAR